ncbi:Hsp70 family protein, partial [Lactiplantibacillus pentosus]|uniref:Hsp70 family protein n=1 Tax=Lactiplantibacillus pentosus TaxID=1589 RepID=UPI003C14EBA4
NAWTIALFLGMPLLSALSTSQLIGEDVRTGFYQHILQHKKQSNYLIKSLLISFIGGALTIVIPLLIDFYGKKIDIHVLQGERPLAADNKTLGRFQLTAIPA